jgi:transcriptional regulator with XRE-family HTH domain
MSEISGSSPCGGRDRSLQRKPNAVDAHVGERLRLRRRLLGLSQEELAARLGLALQQVQKYETGANRVSASRLYQLGRVLEVPVAWFFESMPDDVVDAVRPAEAAVKHEEAALELVRLYALIGDERLRRKLYEIARDFAASGGN